MKFAIIISASLILSNSIYGMQKDDDWTPGRYRFDSPLLKSVPYLELEFESISLKWAPYFIIENYDPNDSEKDNLDKKWSNFKEMEKKESKEISYVPRHIAIQENFLKKYDTKTEDIPK